MIGIGLLLRGMRLNVLITALRFVSFAVAAVVVGDWPGVLAANELAPGTASEQILAQQGNGLATAGGRNVPRRIAENLSSVDRWCGANLLLVIKDDVPIVVSIPDDTLITLTPDNKRSDFTDCS